MGAGGSSNGKGARYRLHKLKGALSRSNPATSDPPAPAEGDGAYRVGELRKLSSGQKLAVLRRLSAERAHARGDGGGGGERERGLSNSKEGPASDATSPSRAHSSPSRTAQMPGGGGGGPFAAHGALPSPNRLRLRRPLPSPSSRGGGPPAQPPRLVRPRPPQSPGGAVRRPPRQPPPGPAPTTTASPFRRRVVRQLLDTGTIPAAVPPHHRSFVDRLKRLADTFGAEKARRILEIGFEDEEQRERDDDERENREHREHREHSKGNHASSEPRSGGSGGGDGSGSGTGSGSGSRSPGSPGSGGRDGRSPGSPKLGERFRPVSPKTRQVRARGGASRHAIEGRQTKTDERNDIRARQIVEYRPKD